MKDRQVKILITGANGFVGRHLYEKLSSQGYNDTYRLIRDESAIILDRGNKTLSFDLTDLERTNEAIQELKPEVVFHLAADVSPSRNLEDLDRSFEVNVIGTKNLLASLLQNQISLKAFINLGSCEEYGINEHEVDENSVPSPISNYSGTKAMTTMLSTLFSNLYKVPIITARPSLIYGPGQGERYFIVQAIKKMIENEKFEMTAGEQQRDFIFAGDVAEALVLLMNKEVMPGEVFNICSGTQYTLAEVVKIIAELTQTHSEISLGAVPYRASEAMKASFSNKKMKEHTGWIAGTSLEEGLQETIRYFRLESHRKSEEFKK